MSSSARRGRRPGLNDCFALAECADSLKIGAGLEVF